MSTESVRTIIGTKEPRTAGSTFTQLLSSVHVQCCFTSTDTIRSIRDGESRTATSTFTQLPGSEDCLSSIFLYVHRDHKDYYRDVEPRTATSTSTLLLSSVHVQCCFTSTETIMTIMDWESRTATSTLTQLLSSEDCSVLLYVHRDHKDYYRDGEPRTATSTSTQLLSSVHVQCCFTSTETIRTVRERGAQDGHLDFHTAPEL